MIGKAKAVSSFSWVRICALLSTWATAAGIAAVGGRTWAGAIRGIRIPTSVVAPRWGWGRNWSLGIDFYFGFGFFTLSLRGDPKGRRGNLNVRLLRFARNDRFTIAVNSHRPWSGLPQS